MTQREIKFRAWDTELKEMGEVLGMYLHPNGWVDIQHGDKETDAEWRTRLNKVHLMQFTGLKDKNGKEIYEGDIVKDWEYIDSYKVIWNREWACFELERITHANDTTQEINYAQFDLEVIGNIYENPELLSS